ncbi:MAG: hypothetical protein E6G23_03260 [Actinobacteria bacterium]|nr:MAG: hypothetical protein E6G23_03260 [Actinomycetota bacterium]
MRLYFGTDGVRGIVGEDLTTELVERLGKAATLWSKGGRVFVGRDTRGSGPELEEAFARGVVEAGGNAVLAGVLPTPAVALLALDLGVVVSASHNPPEYNGIKIFDRDGRKLTDAAEEEIEALLDAEGPGEGRIDRVDVATDSYLEHITDRFGSDLSGLRVAVDCANGAYSAIAPKAFEQLGAEVTAIAAEPDGTNINLGSGATDLSLLQRTVLQADFDLGIAFDGDGDRVLAVDANGASVDGDQILAILADHLNVDIVAVLSAGRAASWAASSRATSFISRTTSPAMASPPRCCSARRSRVARSPRLRRCCRVIHRPKRMCELPRKTSQTTCLPRSRGSTKNSTALGESSSAPPEPSPSYASSLRPKIPGKRGSSVLGSALS